MVRRLMQLGIFVCFFAGNFLGVVEATAQEIPARAVESMEEGARLYESKDWAGAAVAFRRAYEIAPYSIFMFNAGRAAHQNQNLRQAYLYYGRSLEQKEDPWKLSPDLEGRAKAFIEALSVEFAASEISEKVSRMQPEQIDFSWSARGWSGAGVASVGAAMLIASGGFSWAASRGFDEIHQSTTLEAYESSRVRLERNQKFGRWLLYGGSALAMAGLSLMAWDWMEVDNGEKFSYLPRLDLSSDSISARWEVRF